MVRIKVKGDGMVPDGTILEPAYIDNVGDARLSTNDEETYGTSWVFKTAFELLDEEPGAGGYRIILIAKDVLDVHTILDSLSTTMLESATLEKI